MASVFSTPIEPNSAPTSLIAVGRELEDGAREQVRSGSSFSAVADWADTELYHDGTSRSFVLFGSFVVDFVPLQENQSPIADLNHKGHEDHEGGCRSPACRSVSHASAPFESDLRNLVGFAFTTPWLGREGSPRQRSSRHGRTGIPGVSATGDWFSTSGRLHNGDFGVSP